MPRQNTDVFDELYRKLNPRQKEAVDTIEGPVMVVAGPGTGKTQVLTLRIANILRLQDVEPENILALTFTEAAAASMRRRLSGVIGAPGYSVAITTFHSFCNDIIQQYPDAFPRIIGATPITEADEVRVIEGLVASLPLPALRPLGNPLYYVRDIRSAIDALKREDISPNAFAEIVVAEEAAFRMIPDLEHDGGAHDGKRKGKYVALEKKIVKWRDLAVVYRAYQETLERERHYDFSDMIMEARRSLAADEDLLRTLQERYQYVLVDEHQDTNAAQQAVVELLGRFYDNPNIFVVGDEKQAIFRFQGASIENFLHFKSIYSEARLITLTDNYRSHQTILDSAESVLSSTEPLRAADELADGSVGAGRPIEVFSFARAAGEEYFVARSIAALVEAGAMPGSIAVLYRENRDAFPIARMLDRLGVPNVIDSARDVLADPDIRKLILLLRLADNPGSDELFTQALHVDFLHVPPLDAFRVVAGARRRKERLYAFTHAADVIAAEGVADAAAILRITRIVDELRCKSRNEALPDFLYAALTISGFIGHVLALPQAAEKLEALRALFDELDRFFEAHRSAGLADFLSYLDTIEAHRLLIKHKSSGGRDDRVRLMTAHGAKGLEFDFVYIVGCFDGHWSNRRESHALALPARAYARVRDEVEEDIDLADERRLFYVALTRARKHVVISYARESAAGREQLPARFVEEIRPELKDARDGDAFEAELAARPGLLFTVPAPCPAPLAEREFIRALFLERGLSVTALNNFLRCPWEYFYVNLLRIPMRQAPHMMFGTAVHGALQDFFAALKDGQPDKDFLVRRFEERLSREPLTDTELADFSERGRRALGGYHDFYRTEWRTNVSPELGISRVLLGDIPLTGKIDKLEYLDDAGRVRVVDYKTGEPKSRNFIEGMTKADGAGEYKRQLVFYDLLLRLYKDGRYRMMSGEIDFVEPDERGRYRKEIFEITDAERLGLEETIRRAADEIMKAGFWDRFCGGRACEFCDLRRMLKT